MSFNTASGKYYCNPGYKKLEATKGSCFNTASGKYYCNLTNLRRTVKKLVPIPQAVSTIAIRLELRISSLAEIKVSIPQAVSTIAIEQGYSYVHTVLSMGFNTASGKYYCNNKIDAGNLRPGVSIPQAVSTIAM